MPAGGRRRGRRRNDQHPPLGRGGEHARVRDAVLARRRNRGGQARYERERIHVDGGRAVAERTAKHDADEVVGEQPQSLLRDRRAQDEFDESLASAGAVGSGTGGGMQREAHLGDGQGRSGHHARVTTQGNRWTAAPLRPPRERAWRTPRRHGGPGIQGALKLFWDTLLER